MTLVVYVEATASTPKSPNAGVDAVDDVLEHLEPQTQEAPTISRRTRCGSAAGEQHQQHHAEAFASSSVIGAVSGSGPVRANCWPFALPHSEITALLA